MSEPEETASASQQLSEIGLERLKNFIRRIIPKVKERRKLKVQLHKDLESGWYICRVGHCAADTNLEDLTIEDEIKNHLKKDHKIHFDKLSSHNARRFQMLVLHQETEGEPDKTRILPHILELTKSYVSPHEDTDSCLLCLLEKCNKDFRPDQNLMDEAAKHKFLFHEMEKHQQDVHGEDDLKKDDLLLLNIIYIPGETNDRLDLKTLMSEISPDVEEILPEERYDMKPWYLCLLETCELNIPPDGLKRRDDFSAHALSTHGIEDFVTETKKFEIIISHEEIKEPSPNADLSLLVKLQKKLAEKKIKGRTNKAAVCLIGQKCTLEKFIEHSILPQMEMKRHLVSYHKGHNAKTIKIKFILKKLKKVPKQSTSQTDSQSGQSGRRRKPEDEPEQDEPQQPRKKVKTETSTRFPSETRSGEGINGINEIKQEKSEQTERTETISRPATPDMSVQDHFQSLYEASIIDCNSCGCQFRILIKFQDHRLQQAVLKTCLRCETPSAQTSQVRPPPRPKLSECPICKDKCDKLKEHLKERHKVRRVVYFKCVLCGENIPATRKSLDDHNAKCHPHHQK